MKKKNVLSLHEETEKEAAKIEKEILKDSKLEEIKVSDEMEKRLAEQIQAYEKTQSQKKVHRHSPLFRRRVMVAAAVLMIAAVATSVTAVGSKSYLKEIIEKFTGETGQASVINVEDMDTQASESADETQVYREVKKELGIQAVRIQYKPKGMRLQKYILDKEQRRAQIFYEYKGEVVWYSIYMNAEDSSLGQKESDGIIDEFTIENNMKKINVTEYQVKGYEETGFLAEFEDYGVHYQLRGMMERDELEKVLKNLKFYAKNASVFVSSIVYLIEGEGESYENQKKGIVCALCCNVTGNNHISYSSSGAGIR